MELKSFRSINNTIEYACHYNDDKQIRRTGGTMKELEPGNIFHSITFGLNAMGPHASQLTETERWKIVLYVQQLQQYSNE